MFGEGVVVGPDAVSEVDLESAEDAGAQANENRGEGDVAARVLDLFGQGGDAVEADVGERGERGGGEDRAGVEGFGVVDRAGGEHAAPSFRQEQVSDRQDDECADDGGHDGEHERVRARHGADASEVEVGEQSDDERRPYGIGNRGHEALQGERAVDGVDGGDDEVVEEHGPAGEEAGVGPEGAADVGVRGAGGGVARRHASVAERGEHHGDHGDEDGEHDMSAGVDEDDAEDADRRDGLDEDDAVDDEVPHGEDALAWVGGDGVAAG